MSVTSNTPLVTPATNAREITLSPNATADDAIVSGAKKVHAIDLDNSANAAGSYLKLYDNSDPTVGTTVPDEIIYVRGTKRRRITYHDDKLEFATALSVACVTAGGTGGTTAPTSAVTAKITVSD